MKANILIAMLGLQSINIILIASTGFLKIMNILIFLALYFSFMRTHKGKRIINYLNNLINK